MIEESRWGKIFLNYKERTKERIILDDKMTRKAHIAETASKITKYAGIFEKVRYMMPRRCLIILYKLIHFPQNKLWHISLWEYNLGNLEALKSGTKQNFKDSAIQAP